MFFFSSRRRHTRYWRNWSSDVCSSDLLNNFFTTREILERYDAEVIRLFMLSAHYRTPLNFSDELLESAKASNERLYNSIGNLERLLDEVKIEKITEYEKEYIKVLNSYKEKYIEKMDDDFNTADAIAVIFDLIKEINTHVNTDSSKELVNYSLELIRELGMPLGILQKSTIVDLNAEIEGLIEQRQKARKDRDWALADKIRDDLKARGIVLEDTAQGVRWKKEY